MPDQSYRIVNGNDPPTSIKCLTAWMDGDVLLSSIVLLSSPLYF